MILHSPFQISPRLLPALRIGDAWLHLDGLTFILDLPDGSEHKIDDFHPGAGMRDIASWFEAMLSFLGASAESYRYRVFVRGEPQPDIDSNETLFSPAIVEWAYQNSSEIESMQCDLTDENGKTIAGLIE